MSFENPMDRGAWWAAVHGVAKSWTRLSNFTFTFHFQVEAKNPALLSSRDGYLLELTGWTQGSQAS